MSARGDKSRVRQRKERNMKRVLNILTLLALCSSFAFAGGIFYGDRALEAGAPFEPSYDYNKVLVTWVVDGDTLKLENGEKVRLIGIDTPETKHNAKLKRDLKKTDKDAETLISMGERAARLTTVLAFKKYVRLEFDIEKRDRYNRLLAYAYLPDGRMLNAEIVKAGYAQMLTIPPNVKYQDLFLELQGEARENNRGLWAE